MIAPNYDSNSDGSSNGNRHRKNKKKSKSSFKELLYSNGPSLLCPFDPQLIPTTKVTTFFDDEHDQTQSKISVLPTFDGEKLATLPYVCLRLFAAGKEDNYDDESYWKVNHIGKPSPRC